MANVGRPPQYKSVEEIEDKIEQYFAICEGESLLDEWDESEAEEDG